MSIIPKARVIDVENPPPISSVELIKQVIENINATITSLDLEIAAASKGDAAMVKALYDCVHEISSRTQQAEMILLDITADPDKLQDTVARMDPCAATLSKLNHLIHKIEELEKELYEGEFDYFSIVADLLTEVLEEMEAFQPYVAIPQVSIVHHKIEAIETELKRQVQWTFREIGQLTSSEKYEYENPSENSWSVDVSSLTQVYLVVDVLGEKFRKDLLERFAQLQLIPYEKLFQFGTKYASVDQMDQRFTWFRYLLHVVDEKLSDVLPSKWVVEYYLFLEFVRRTKQHLSEVLQQEKRKSPDINAQVQYLLRAVTQVNNFEKDMLSSFVKRVGDDSISKKLDESIRDAFDPFLGGYVQIERQGLEELMEQLLRNEDSAAQTSNAPGESGATPPPASYLPGEPYASSRKLFEYIKGSLNRCTEFSNGLTFLSLSKEFRVCLQNYSQSLKYRCPNPVPQQKPTKHPVYMLNKATEATLCRIICTGEYCIDTVPALETLMKQRIQKQYVDQVDFQYQIDTFMDMISFTMTVLASGEIQRMDVDFQNMKKINWMAVETVDDVGAYTKHMLKILGDCVPRIRLSMSSIYFQQVCSRLATTFLDSFLENIWTLKRISKNGGGQLLLDLNGIKEYLVKMPNARLPEGRDPIVISKPYQMAVKSKVTKVENILKLICSEENMTEEMFTVLWPEATKDEMDAILILKGQKSEISQVGDILKDGAKAVGQKTVGNIKKVSQGAVGDLSTGLSKVSTGFKSAFGDIISGNLFTENNSSHDDRPPSNHGYSSNANAAPPKPKLDLKGAVSGVGAAMSLKKPTMPSFASPEKTKK